MARPLAQIPIVGKVVEQYRERLTPRGRYVFWCMVTLAAVGLDTRRTQVYVLFALAAAIFLVAAIQGLLRPRPRIQLECRMPERVTALVPLAVHARVDGNGRALRDLQFTLPRPQKWGSSIQCSPPAVYFDVEPNKPAGAK